LAHHSSFLGHQGLNIPVFPDNRLRYVKNNLSILLTIILFCHKLYFETNKNLPTMRKADLVNQISEKTGIPKVDVLVTLETMFKEVKDTLAAGENIYIRGFGSFITKKRAAKIGRNIKKNIAVHIPEHYIPAFKPAKEFVAEVKKLKEVKPDAGPGEDA
jgi:DNA-binding protein HU-beta